MVLPVSGEDATQPPPCLARGDLTGQREERYRELLEAYHGRLTALCRAWAPDLIPRLEADPPAPVPSGYGILPRIVPDSPPPAGPRRAISARYGWPETETMIAREVERIRGAVAALEGLSLLAEGERRRSLEGLAEGWGALREAQRTVNAHLRHNRLWQSAVAADPEGYRRATFLHDAVLERQAIVGGGEVSAADRDRLDALDRMIREATRPGAPPVPLEAVRSPGSTEVILPLATDISDAVFLEEFRRGVEAHWRGEVGAEEVALRLEILRLPPEGLFCPPGSPPGCSSPGKGESPAVERHLGLFPPTGGILTTGAGTTHVRGRALLLGPQDIPPRVLAHEVGHLLGFRDAYFRGCRDLGGDGFAILEVVADPLDIMGAPGEGSVLPRHLLHLRDLVREPPDGE